MSCGGGAAVGAARGKGISSPKLFFQKGADVSTCGRCQPLHVVQVFERIQLRLESCEPFFEGFRTDKGICKSCFALEAHFENNLSHFLTQAFFASHHQRGKKKSSKIPSFLKQNDYRANIHRHRLKPHPGYRSHRATHLKPVPGSQTKTRSHLKNSRSSRPIPGVLHSACKQICKARSTTLRPEHAALPNASETDNQARSKRLLSSKWLLA